MKTPIFLELAVMFMVAGYIATAAGNSQQPASDFESKMAEAPKDTSGAQGRSSENIMEVVKVNTPNRLKPLYNNFLLRKPGFEGKISVKFKILPDGKVESGEIVSATTNFPEFEKEVLHDVLQWKFDAGNYKNCTVTIPFTFVDEGFVKKE